MNDGLKLNWQLIIIDDSNFLRSKSICDIIYLMLICIKLEYIVLNDIEGSAKEGLMPVLWEKENIVFKLEEILTLLCKVEQFEWGDLLLFKNFPKDWEKLKDNRSYLQKIALTDVTVRAVDGQYLYIYTQNQQIVDTIIKENKIESIKFGALEDLEYPY